MHFAFRQYFLLVSGTELSHLHQLRLPHVLWGSSFAALSIRKQIPILSSRSSVFTMEEQGVQTRLTAGVLLQGQVRFALQSGADQLLPYCFALLLLCDFSF